FLSVCDKSHTYLYILSLHDALPILDNRIKLLEEILSFRMQGFEFDNGDMYVDGHKAASDVRDEFVSVTEKLMDELAQCYNVLPQDRKSGSAGMPRPISYAVFCLIKKKHSFAWLEAVLRALAHHV